MATPDFRTARKFAFAGRTLFVQRSCGHYEYMESAGPSITAAVLVAFLQHDLCDACGLEQHHAEREQQEYEAACAGAESAHEMWVNE
jgi:hypothetical protein